MWVAIALGTTLGPPLAALLDRVFADIAFYWMPETDERSRGSNSFAGAFRDAGIAFERFSSLWETTAVAHFHLAPVCFVPVSSSAAALDNAADRAAAFAHHVGKLLDGHLGVRRTATYTGVSPDALDDWRLMEQIDQLTTQTEELLRSGNWANIVLAHRMLLRAQALCALLARLRPLRALAYSMPAAAARV